MITMNYLPYETQKEQFDTHVMQYIAKRVISPIKDSDACKVDIIDDIGNEVSDINDNNKWAFTNLDRFILAIKQLVGERKLVNLLNVYNWLGDVDPLRLINNADTITASKFKTQKSYLDKIISLFDGIDYLPGDLQNTSGYIRDTDEHLTFPDFNGRCSWALTLCSFLLYTIRQNNIPTSIDFDGNILPSTTLTFNVRPYNDYQECKSYLTSNGLVDTDGITHSGIKLLHSISKLLVDGELLTFVGGRIEERSRDWKKLSGIGAS